MVRAKSAPPTTTGGGGASGFRSSSACLGGFMRGLPSDRRSGRTRARRREATSLRRTGKPESRRGGVKTSAALGGKPARQSLATV